MIKTWIFKNRPHFLLAIRKARPLERRSWSRFLISISLILFFFTFGIFLGILVRNRQLREREVLSRARSYFQQIVITRRWNAMFGGVYVEKKNGIKSNPYLKNPDVRLADGRIFTKKNPALMTREISELAGDRGLFTFHITSLRPINPGNRPDVFERQALRNFELGYKESSSWIRRGDRDYFRYMAPLITERSCLQCHGVQGYRLGDIRGGISVEFDVSDIEKSIRQQTWFILFLAMGVSVLLLFLILHFTGNLMSRLNEAYEKIERLSIVDDLTRLYNRRHFINSIQTEFERAKRYSRPISLLMIDIDHFKQVNDDFGHLTGDAVLVKISAMIVDCFRMTDTVARYGGEEIAVILPETNETRALVAAKKVRSLIRENPIVVEPDLSIPITVSIGVVTRQPADFAALKDYSQLIRLADEALYQAKKAGRDRVVME